MVYMVYMVYIACESSEMKVMGLSPNLGMLLTAPMSNSRHCELSCKKKIVAMSSIKTETRWIAMDCNGKAIITSLITIYYI
jgi:hypothetical protein